MHSFRIILWYVLIISVCFKIIMLWQGLLWNCHGTRWLTPSNMGELVIRIQKEPIIFHDKAKNRKTMCTFHGIYSLIAKALASISIQHRSGTFVLHGCLIDIDPKGFVICVIFHCRVHGQLPPTTAWYSHRSLPWDARGIWKYVYVPTQQGIICPT